MKVNIPVTLLEADMYKLHETEKAVEEIQTYLNFIRDRRHEEITFVSIDGIYGIETEKAVSDFQALYGLQVSGIVDYETYEMLYSVYLETETVSPLVTVSNTDFPVVTGTEGTTALLINRMLADIREAYIDIPRPNTGPYIGQESLNSIIALSERIDLPYCDVIDTRVYNRLALEALTLEEI